MLFIAPALLMAPLFIGGAFGLSLIGNGLGRSTKLEIKKIDAASAKRRYEQEQADSVVDQARVGRQARLNQLNTSPGPDQAIF